MNFEQTVVSGAEATPPLAAACGWPEISEGRNLKNM
jgi:hypothetical protein